MHPRKESRWKALVINRSQSNSDNRMLEKATKSDRYFTLIEARHQFIFIPAHFIPLLLPA